MIVNFLFFSARIRLDYKAEGKNEKVLGIQKNKRRYLFKIFSHNNGYFTN